MAGASDKKIYQWDARTNQVEQVSDVKFCDRPYLKGIIRTLSAIIHTLSAYPCASCHHPYPNLNTIIRTLKCDYLYPEVHSHRTL
jgi:hypothetical protein